VCAASSLWIAVSVAIKGSPIEYFKTLMGEATLLTNASDAEGCFMDHLQGNSGFDAGGGLSAPSDQEVPGTEPKVLWHQEPQAQQITRHLVGQ